MPLILIFWVRACWLVLQCCFRNRGIFSFLYVVATIRLFIFAVALWRGCLIKSESNCEHKMTLLWLLFCLRAQTEYFNAIPASCNPGWALKRCEAALPPYTNLDRSKCWALLTPGLKMCSCMFLNKSWAHEAWILIWDISCHLPNLAPTLMLSLIKTHRSRSTRATDNT